MTSPSLIILYVDNPASSAAFYSDLLGRSAVESSANFVMFALEAGLMLGLWARHDVAPKAGASAGAVELVFPVSDMAEVNTLHGNWKSRGLPIAQEPVAMDFGYTFVALDPDQHRLRVFAPAPRD